MGCTRFSLGTMRKGERNLITDVPGVTVGQKAIDKGDVHTGVTAILPHQGNLFKEKLVASCHVLNGFGKSAGLMQVEELGTIETPIILSNTFAVGTASNAIISYSLEKNPDIGRETGTVNPLAFECNDGYLSDIRAMAVTEEDVRMAIDSASASFKEGAAGGGRGMMCYGLKGGIGSSSRIVAIGNKEYTLGALLMTNFGSMEDLVIAGDPIGRKLTKHPPFEDKGSVITILATNAPLSSRQLGRICHRVQSGIARTGSFMGSGSGEVVLAFSTATHIPHYEAESVTSLPMLAEKEMNKLFKATVEAVEESVVSSLEHAQTLVGRNGNTARSLSEMLPFRTIDNSSLSK